MESFLELAKRRYSVRKYKDIPVEQEKIDRILEAGRVAPTACNNQPEKIYVIKSPEKRRALSMVCPCIFDAPLVFVIAYDIRRSAKGRLYEGYQFGETDAAIVTTHMMLEATELGLGTCWVGWFNNEEVKTVLGLPEHIFVQALLPTGYAADGVKPSHLHEEIRPLSDIAEEL